MRSGAAVGAAVQVTMEVEVAVAASKAGAAVSVHPSSHVRATFVTTKLAVVHACCRENTRLIG